MLARSHRHGLLSALLLVLALGQAAAAPPQADAAQTIVERTANDKVTVRAVRVASPLRIDGRLDDEVYVSVPPISGFIQQEPHEGAPATEKTDAWILFDDENLYIAARCWDSHPEREIANELRRDNGNILGNENFTFVIDTLHDGRNGYLFQTNPLGGLRVDHEIQPRCPQPQRGPCGSMAKCPSSPPVVSGPLKSSPLMINPPPTPVPRVSTTTFLQPRPEP